MIIRSLASGASIPERSGSSFGAARGRACRQLGRSYWLLLLLFIALQVADIVTTNHALAVPGSWEANPVMAAFQSRLGSLWWLPKAAVVAWIVVAATRIRRRWPMIFAVTYCGVVVVLNLASQ
jgi:hypothetical protein